LQACPAASKVLGLLYPCRYWVCSIVASLSNSQPFLHDLGPAVSLAPICQASNCLPGSCLHPGSSTSAVSAVSWVAVSSLHSWLTGWWCVSMQSAYWCPGLTCSSCKPHGQLPIMGCRSLHSTCRLTVQRCICLSEHCLPSVGCANWHFEQVLLSASFVTDIPAAAHHAGMCFISCLRGHVERCSWVAGMLSLWCLLARREPHHVCLSTDCTGTSWYCLVACQSHMCGAVPSSTCVACPVHMASPIRRF
jgi:hypothetical protein